MPLSLVTIPTTTSTAIYSNNSYRNPSVCVVTEWPRRLIMYHVKAVRWSRTSTKCPDWVWDKRRQALSVAASVRWHSQLKMPGGGCWVTTGQFSSSLLSPQLFSWLQISEPRRKQFPLVQWNLHSAVRRSKRVRTSTNSFHFFQSKCSV